MSEQMTVAAEFPERDGRLAFVGGFPSVHDGERGRPFVGPVGKVFDAILRSANVDRRECFIGNVFETPPIDDDAARHREVLGAEWPAFLQQNVERLNEQLKAVNPHVIVPLGDLALQVLGGDSRSSQLRGSVMGAVAPFPPFKLLPTFHPETVMKVWKNYPIAIGDVVRAVAEAERGRNIVYPQRTLHLFPTLAEVKEFLYGPCLETDLLSVDIETGWSQIRGISFAPSAEEAMYVPFISLASLNRSYWTDAATECEAWTAVKTVLESGVPKLGQNFAHYDAVWLFKRAGIRVRNLREDTRLLHHALYAELPKSLQFLGAAYSTQGAWKHWANHGISKKDRGEKRDE